MGQPYAEILTNLPAGNINLFQLPRLKSMSIPGSEQRSVNIAFHRVGEVNTFEPARIRQQERHFPSLQAAGII